MSRLFVPVTLHFGVVVETDNKEIALREARRLAEACGPDGHFIDGWNDIQRLVDEPTIYAVGDFDVEWIDANTIQPAEIDDGCPKGDPDCLGANGDCHDACSTFAEREPTA